MLSFNVFMLDFLQRFVLIIDYENYYPKNKKEIPKGGEQKTESKGVPLFDCFSFLEIDVFWVSATLFK